MEVVAGTMEENGVDAASHVAIIMVATILGMVTTVVSNNTNKWALGNGSHTASSRNNRVGPSHLALTLCNSVVVPVPNNPVFLVPVPNKHILFKLPPIMLLFMLLQILMRPCTP